MISSIDHIVLVVADVSKTVEFYERVLGIEGDVNSDGKCSLKFGKNKISLQQEGKVPAIAQQTLRGTANFCLLSKTPIRDIVEKLQRFDVEIIEGPGEKEGAVGPINSIYFYDPDGNLVEIANQL